MTATLMIGINKHPAALAALLVFLSCSLNAAEHSLDFSTRARYSDLQVGDDAGKAASIRLRASLDSSWSDAFSTFVEADYVETGYENQHSDGVRFNGQPLIPDVPGGEINQLLLAYDGGLTHLQLGRQRIELDDQRFVGSQEFWQNDQTFDAFFSTTKVWTSSKFNYGYIWNANRILGDDADSNLRPSDNNFEALNGLRPAGRLGDHEHDSHLVRLEINEWDFTRVVLYSYLLDSDDDPSSSSQNYGASYAIKIKPSVFHYKVELEAATRKRTQIAGEPQPHYLRAAVAAGYRSLELGVRQERLSSDEGTSFFTTLGSRHEFQGWADQFGRPPSSGLIDSALQLRWRKSPWKLDLRYHFFAQDTGSERLGEEFDFDLAFSPVDQHTLHLRVADYKAPAELPEFKDTRRIFLSYSFKFSSAD